MIKNKIRKSGILAKSSCSLYSNNTLSSLMPALELFRLERTSYLTRLRVSKRSSTCPAPMASRSR